MTIRLSNMLRFMILSCEAILIYYFFHNLPYKSISFLEGCLILYFGLSIAYVLIAFLVEMSLQESRNIVTQLVGMATYNRYEVQHFFGIIFFPSLIVYMILRMLIIFISKHVSSLFEFLDEHIKIEL